MLDLLQYLLSKARPFVTDPAPAGEVHLVAVAGPTVLVGPQRWSALRKLYPKLQEDHPGDQVLVAYRDPDSGVHLALLPRPHPGFPAPGQPKGDQT